jgi:hypothetical protein
MSNEEQRSVDVVEYKGIKFRRYPKSIHGTCRNYYTPNSAYRRQGVGALHREIWKDAHGPIPEGCEIHHKDGNPLNNDISNLECVTSEEHKAIHRIWEESPARRNMRAANLYARAREAAAAWHKSDAGREWHRAMAYYALALRKPVTKRCEHCGNEYQTDDHSQRFSRYCSNNCKVAARYASGVDDEQRICVFCGNQFTINRYAPARCCSRACSNRMRAGHPPPT